ncbi:MAG: SDR family NAD(P)-dependent oxidoreductase [Proteobacteria bacterium]|nr:SDR family NAD(P)-dependent oxidoreductase [Pseudomonadota bacterium]
MPLAASDFRGRYGPWALVTGAAGGLGQAFARALGARGLNLVLSDLEAEPLEAVARAVEADHGVATRPLALDLTQPACAETAGALAAELELGLLVNNAGVSHIGRFADLPLDAHLQGLELHGRAAVTLTHILVQPMRRRGRGGVLFVSSGSAAVHSPWVAHYAATKAYQLALAEALYEELRHEGVDAMALVAGLTRTETLLRAGLDVGRAGVLLSEPRFVAERTLDALGSGPSFEPNLVDRLSTLVVGRWLPRRFALRLVRRSFERLFPRIAAQRDAGDP